MIGKYALACVSAAVLACPAYAQLGDNQIWTGFALSGPVDADSKLLVWFDAHARLRDDGSELGVTILRPGLGWKIDDTVSVWAGYARVTSDGGSGDIEEDRVWQQLTYKLPAILGGELSARSRLEQRWRGTGDETGWRVRQQFRWSRSLGNTAPSIVAWNETFIAMNDTDWGQRDGYDQNRVFVGLGWRANEKASFEIGYLNNHLTLPSGRITNHNLSLSFSAKP